MLKECDTDIEKSYLESLKLLKQLTTEKGFLASLESKQNYGRIWARDGVITGLASLMSDDLVLINSFKDHLNFLKKYQGETGRIPSNISLNEKSVSYGTLVGKVDSTLWYIIGVCQYYLYTNDKNFIESFKDSLKKAFFYLECLELNSKGFLFVPTGGDWADEYITHGYVLFDQLLYLQAIKDYERISKFLKNKDLVKKLRSKRIKLKNLIEINFFPNKSKKNSKYVYNDGLYSKLVKGFKKDYALSYFSSDGFSNHFDGFANSLLLNMDFNEKSIKKMEKDLLKKVLGQRLKILPAFWPPITPKEKYLWNALKTNSLFIFKNKPHYYHNGGLWPVIQGFFISGIKDKEIKKDLLYNFSCSLERNKYQFHEYYESLKFTPQGTKKMAYSASGYIIAYLSTIKNKKVFI